MSTNDTARYLVRRLGLDEKVVAVGAALLDEGIRQAKLELGVGLEPADIVDALVAHIGAESLTTDFAETVSGLRVAELCLTIACARHDKTAIERFESTYGPTVDAACRRFSAQISFDEARQRVRERLLFAPRPGVASYAGTGELAGWVRVSAVRCLINALTRGTQEEPVDDECLESLAADEIDPERSLSRKESKEAFRVAFIEAFEQLTNREKSLLRYAYADGQTVDRIGMVYRVHRATAARWVMLAREKLVAAVVEGLIDRLDIDTDDVPSILRSALSDIPTTVMRHLRGE